MNTRIVALALAAIAGIAANSQAQIKLSDMPPGAIHTPGIGPGYMYPSYPIPAIGAYPRDGLSGSAQTSAMMPGGLPADLRSPPDRSVDQPGAARGERSPAFTTRDITP